MRVHPKAVGVTLKALSEFCLGPCCGVLLRSCSMASELLGVTGSARHWISPIFRRIISRSQKYISNAYPWKPVRSSEHQRLKNFSDTACAACPPAPLLPHCAGVGNPVIGRDDGGGGATDPAAAAAAAACIKCN